MRTIKYLPAFLTSLIVLVACSADDGAGGFVTDQVDTVDAGAEFIECPGAYEVLSVNVPVTDRNLSEGQNHCYVLDVIADETYTLTLSPSSGDQDLILLAAEPLVEANLIDYSIEENLSPDVIIHTPASNGTVYIVVNAFISGTYELKVSVEVPDLTPIAVINTVDNAFIGQTYTLDGSESKPDAEEIGYDWTLISRPVASTLTWGPEADAVTTFMPDAFGEYEFQLVVDNGTDFSDPVTAVISVAYEFEQLDYQVVDAEYSEALESIVLVSSGTPELHVYDTTTGIETRVSLPLSPTSVSVSPDGMYAAVGHDGWVSYVDLVTPSVIKTVSVTTDVIDIVLGDNGYIYAFPRTDQWERIRAVEISTEVETLSTGIQIRAGTLAKLHPGGEAIYGADNGLSPSDIEKYDISSGPVSYLYDSPYHGDYAMCGDLWIAEDGLRIFTRCGFVFKSSVDTSLDMTYNGALENIGSLRVKTLDHSSESGKVVAVFEDSFLTESEPPADTQVRLFDYEFLTADEIIQIPGIPVGSAAHLLHGKRVFFNSDGSRYFILMQADGASGLLNDFAIISSE